MLKPMAAYDMEPWEDWNDPAIISRVYDAAEVDAHLARLEEEFWEIVGIMVLYAPPQSRRAAREKASILWEQAKENDQ